MRVSILALSYFKFSVEGYNDVERHGPNGNHNKKPWLMFTKKYVGGKCAWDHDRTDCAICAKTACSEGFQIKRSTYEFLRNFEFLRILFLKMENPKKCFGINKNRCFDCKDERICYADQVFQTPDNFWTKTKDGCECKWKKKDDGPECACCYPGGQQCESNKTRNKCIGPKDSQDMCSVEKKYKIADKIDWDKPAEAPSKTVIPFSVGDSKPDKPNKQNPFKPFKPDKDDDDHDDDHDDHHDNDDDDHYGSETEVSLQIPLSPEKEIIDKILSDLEDAQKGKEVTNVLQEIETCNPVAPLYVPIFFWPATSEDSDGEQRCRDPFWLSLRHGGANVRIIVQTRSLPSKIDGIEKTAIQACIDHVIEGDTSVLGYVDADFQNRPMKEILKDIRAWSTEFNHMTGIYLDPVGITLKGQNLDYLLSKISDFVRDNIFDFELIVFNPQSDFYGF